MEQYKESYNQYKLQAINLVSQENSSVYNNALINKTYYALAKDNPYFLWFAGSALGAAKVGENLLYG